MGKIRLLTFFAVLFTVQFSSVQFCFAVDACLVKRQDFIRHFRAKAYTNPGDLPANIHDASDLLEDGPFEALCVKDREKMKRIVYSTFRIQLLDENEKRIEVDGSEITGTLVGTRTLIVSFPEEINSFKNYWLDEKGKFKDLKLKLINIDEEEATLPYHFKVVRTSKIGERKLAAVFAYGGPIVDVNKDFEEETKIGLTRDEIIGDYNSFISKDGKNLNGNIFFFGFDDDDMMAGFGLTDQFVEIDGKINVSSFERVSAFNFGGGVYDQDFNLIGMHYYNTVYSSNPKRQYKRIFNVVDRIPTDIVNSAWNYVRIDQMLKEQKESKIGSKSIAPVHPTKPHKGTGFGLYTDY